MKRFIFIQPVILFCFGIIGTTAQQRYTLQQCIDTALLKNVQVRKAELTTAAEKVNFRQAKNDILPNLNIGFGHNLNEGRNIDPFTNAYVNQSINYEDYGLNSNITVFNGMILKNHIKSSKLLYAASEMEFQQEKDNLTLNVILAYLTILNNEDLVSTAMQQKDLSSKQLGRLQVLDSQGAINPSQLSDVQGQVLNDELTILDLQNQLATSRLTLSRLMNITYDEEMTLERIDAADFLTAYSKKPDEVYAASLKQFSFIRAAELREKSYTYALRAARGGYYPALIFGANAQTNYSSTAENNAGKIGYSEQVRNNVYSGLNIGVSIPVFNFFRTRNNVRLADIDLRNGRLVTEDAKLQVKQEIDEAYLNLTNAYKRYQTLVKQLTAYDKSFKAAEIRFNAGVGTSVDYLIAKNNVDRAAINLISARYNFVLRKKILDYYESSGPR